MNNSQHYTRKWKRHGRVPVQSSKRVYPRSAAGISWDPTWWHKSKWQLSRLESLLQSWSWDSSLGFVIPFSLSGVEALDFCWLTNDTFTLPQVSVYTCRCTYHCFRVPGLLYVCNPSTARAVVFHVRLFPRYVRLIVGDGLPAGGYVSDAYHRLTPSRG